MKRGSPLRTRKPLRARKPLRRLTRLRARSKTNSYRRRARDTEYMLWVKRQPCILRTLPPVSIALLDTVHPYRPIVAMTPVTPCCGRVEADHMGERGMGQKADDRTCVPMCRNHHSERHAHAGTFFHLTRDDLRAWRTAAIERTQAAWEKR